MFAALGAFLLDAAETIGTVVAEGAATVGKTVVDGASAVGKTVAEGASKVGDVATQAGEKVASYAKDGVEYVGDKLGFGEEAAGEAVTDAEAMSDEVWQKDLAEQAMEEGADAAPKAPSAKNFGFRDFAKDAFKGAMASEDSAIVRESDGDIDWGRTSARSIGKGATNLTKHLAEDRLSQGGGRARGLLLGAAFK